MVNDKIINRSDACVAVRAVPVVEAMTALVLANFLTIAQTHHSDNNH